MSNQSASLEKTYGEKTCFCQYTFSLAFITKNAIFCNESKERKGKKSLPLPGLEPGRTKCSQTPQACVSTNFTIMASFIVACSIHFPKNSHFLDQQSQKTFLIQKLLVFGMEGGFLTVK